MTPRSSRHHPPRCGLGVRGGRAVPHRGYLDRRNGPSPCPGQISLQVCNIRLDPIVASGDLSFAFQFAAVFVIIEARRLTGGKLDFEVPAPPMPDRKSTRLNSSHLGMSYAVFFL